MERFLLNLAAIIGLVHFAISPAQAEITELEAIFVKADMNGDLVIGKAEFIIVMAKQFDETDSDRNNSLDKKEIGDLANDPEFTDNDTDKNGALSIEEVIKEKLSDFAAADTNNDGVLSFEEVQKFYENKK